MHDVRNTKIFIKGGEKEKKTEKEHEAASAKVAGFIEFSE